MGVASYDAVEDVINMLETVWNNDNVDVPKPRITKNWEEKTTGIIDDTQDIVVVTPGDEKVEYYQLYGVAHLHSPTIIIDIRGYGTEARHRSVVNHIDNIIKAQVRRPNYVDLMLMATKNLSHDYRNIFRHVMEVRYRKLCP